MKRNFLLILAILLLMSVSLVACLEDEETTASTSSNSTDLPPAEDHEHYYAYWETIVLPTMDSEGLEESQCLLCGEKVTRVVDKLDFANDLVFRFNNANQTYSVAKNQKHESKYVVIPDTYNGFPVVSIDEYAFSKNKNIIYVVIPDSVTSLGQNVFYDCSNLREVVIGNGITEIPADDTNPKEGMFGNCKRLESVTLSNALAVIGDRAFYGCSSLESITIPDSVHTVGSAAFQRCTLLKEINLGKGIVTIGSYYDDSIYDDTGAFLGCTSLETITLPVSVKTIYTDAFKGCSSLANVYYEGDIDDWCKITFVASTSNPVYRAGNLYFKGELVSDVVIPNSITAVPNHLFSGCKTLESVTIPDLVTVIENGAFMNCSSLKVIDWSENIERIGEIEVYQESSKVGAFEGCTSLESITLPDSVQTLGMNTFAGCESLTSIVIPTSVTTMGSGAFADCDSLNEAYYLGNLENWCEIVFQNSYGNPASKATHLYINGEFITDVTIPDSITEVKSSTFAEYKSLKSITFHENVKKVERFAFSNCTSLENVTIYSPDILIDKQAFGEVTGIKLNEYDNALYLGNEDNPYLMLFKAKNYSITSCEIHPSTSVINANAFFGCEDLVSIYMPDSILVVGETAFWCCFSLESVRISNELIIMGHSVFANCVSLQYNEYNGSRYLGNEDNPYLLLAGYKEDSNVDCLLHPNTKIIGSEAFTHNMSIRTITVPDSVEVICHRAFAYCNKLSKVYIPDSVKTVGSDIFAEYYEGKIYCEADSIPDGWDAEWRLGHISVIYWGYTKE